MQCNQIEDQELIVPYHLNYINPCYLMLFQTISHHFTLFWTHLHGKNPKRMVKPKHIPNLNQHIPLITWSDLIYSILFLTSSKCLFIHRCCCRYWLGTDKREGRGGKGREGKGKERRWGWCFSKSQTWIWSFSFLIRNRIHIHIHSRSNWNNPKPNLISNFYIHFKYKYKYKYKSMSKAML